MFINNYETPFSFQNTDDSSFYSDFESRFLKNERGRINNIHNENFDLNFKENLFFEKNPKINFLINIKVTKEEFELYKKESEKITNNLNNKILLNIFSVDRLLNIQKHLMEIFNYFVFLDQNLDWNHFRNRIDIFYLKEKMLKIKFEEINIKQINFYLNRFAPLMNFPRFIPFSTGMNYLYKWVKCQINILAYMYNNKMLERKENNNNNNNNNNEDENNNNNNNNNENNNNENNNNNYSNVLSKSAKIKNFNQMFLENNKNNNINYDNNNNKFNINNYEFSTNNNNNINNNITSDYNNISNNILITNLSYSKNLKNKENKETNFNYSNNNNNNNNYSKPIIKNTILKLNGYNAIAEKIYKEKKVLEYLPLINNRTFQQMRKFYNLIDRKNDYKIYNLHREQILNNSLSGLKNKNRAIKLISNNKISLISELPEQKFNDLLVDNN
jgi:hypothetical protein